MSFFLFSVELWKDVKDYEGIYQVSSFGRFKSFKFGKGKIFNHNPTNKNHYIRIHLCNNGEMRDESLHVLVALAFIDNPENKKTVNHKNGNKQNNFWWNLEWNTYDENNKHAKSTGLNKTIGETHHWAILTEKEVMEIVQLDSPNKEIAEKYGVSKTTISHIFRGKTWSHITGIILKVKPKLKKNQVIEIYKSPLSRTELAKIFGVTDTCIGYIKKGVSYRSITAHL